MVSRLERRKRNRPFTEPGRNAARKWADVRRRHLAAIAVRRDRHRLQPAAVRILDARADDDLADWLTGSGICALRRAIVATLCPPKRWRLEESA
jgi:hypothetical protein